MPTSPTARRVRLIVAVVAVAAVAVGVVVWRVVRPDADRDEGLRLARSGDFGAAEPLLTAASDRNPADPDVAEALARGYLAAENPRAEAALTRWAKVRPDDPEPVRQRMAYYWKRKDPRAYDDARKVSDLVSDDPDARRRAMNYAFSFGKFAEAEGLCRTLLRRQPENVGLRLMLVDAQRAGGKRDTALATARAVLADHPKHPGALLALAVLYEDAGESEKAVPLLREVFQNDPGRRRTAGYQLAIALGRVGRADEAAQVLAHVRRLQDVEIAQGAISSRPDDLALQVRLAEQMLADGHAADGLRLLDQVLARSPREAAAHRVLAAHYAAAGDAARADAHRRQMKEFKR